MVQQQIKCSSWVCVCNVPYRSHCPSEGRRHPIHAARPAVSREAETLAEGHADEFVYVYMNILIIANHNEDAGDLKHDSRTDRTSDKDFLVGSHQSVVSMDHTGIGSLVCRIASPW